MMLRRNQAVRPLVAQLIKEDLPYKLVARELAKRGFVNSKGEPYSRDSVKIIVREIRAAERWPLAPG